MKLTTKLTIGLVFLVLLLIIGIFSGVLKLNTITSSRESQHKIVLQKIEELGSLELVKFNYNDVVEEAIKRKFLDIDQLAPDSKVLLIIAGEATACIDLTKVQEDDINVGENVVKIVLPRPELCYVKIDHNRSKIYDANFTARLLNPELIDEGFKNAETRIRNDAIGYGILDQAKENARKILVPLFNEITHKKVTISFKID